MRHETSSYMFLCPDQSLIVDWCARDAAHMSRETAPDQNVAWSKNDSDPLYSVG
jgi:hypothetical protein